MNTIGDRVRLTDRVRSEVGNKNNKPSAMANQILEQMFCLTETKVT